MACVISVSIGAAQRLQVSNVALVVGRSSFIRPYPTDWSVASILTAAFGWRNRTQLIQPPRFQINYAHTFTTR